MDKSKILIVDDRRENIDALSRLIEADDLEIFSAQDAETALGLVLDHEFALALLDVQMPAVDGFELARLVRGVRRGRDLPIIFVTAMARDPSVVFEGYGTGAVDLLFKPLDPHVVRSKTRVFVQLDLQSKQLRKQMEELERLRADADAANVAKSRFLANMSHEIRTPLAAVMGFADVISQNAMDEAEREECAGAIHRNGQLLLRLIDDILDISKIEAQKLELDAHDFDLAQLLSDVEAALARRAQEKGVALSFVNRAAVGRRYRADSVRIKQILLNIVGNALKFTERGGVTVTAEIEGQAEAQMPGDGVESLLVAVQDTGVGLDEEQAQKLFHAFAQADASTQRQFGGTGLGLMIARQLARMLGGDVWLESSTPGEGSVFKIRLALPRAAGALRAGGAKPRAAATPPTDPAAAFAPPAPSAKGAAADPAYAALAGRRVMAVDDVVDNRKLIERYLAPHGVIVTTAASGPEAIKAASDDEIDLILMDVQMPTMDGYEATRAIRERGFTGPILALTAHAMRDEIEKCRASGCDDVIVKPVSRGHLLAALAAWLIGDDAGLRSTSATSPAEATASGQTRPALA